MPVGASLTLSNGATATYASGSGTPSVDVHVCGLRRVDAARRTSRSPAIAAAITDNAGNALVAAGVTEDTGVAIRPRSDGDDLPT